MTTGDISLNNPNRATVDVLLVPYDEGQRIKAEPETIEANPPFRFTGEGLAVLAGLITAGLIEISKRHSGTKWLGGGMSSFEVQITEAGRRLVRAWRSGVPSEVVDALYKKSNETEYLT